MTVSAARNDLTTSPGGDLESVAPRGDSSPIDAPLTREQATRLAWLRYENDPRGHVVPVVVELLLLADNCGAPQWLRYAVDQALEWFDPRAEMPARPPEEELALRVVRQLGLGRDVKTRDRAAARLLRLLAEAA